MPPSEMSNRPVYPPPAEDAEVPDLLPTEEEHQGAELAPPLLMPGVGAPSSLMPGPPNLMCGPAPHQPWAPPQYQQQSFPQAPHGYPYPYGPYGYRYENRSHKTQSETS